MLQAFAEVLMSAQASMQCQAGYGERSEERINSRNGYRTRDWDTRVGTIELAIPKLREGTYYRLFGRFRGCYRPGRGGQWPPRSRRQRAMRLVVERKP